MDFWQVSHANLYLVLQHLLYSDGISWGVLSNIRLTEDDTTSSSRIFIKILFQALSEDMGLIELNARLQEPSLQPFFGGIFPKVRPRVWLTAALSFQTAHSQSAQNNLIE